MLRLDPIAVFVLNDFHKTGVLEGLAAPFFGGHGFKVGLPFFEGGDGTSGGVHEHLFHCFLLFFGLWPGGRPGRCGLRADDVAYFGNGVFVTVGAKMIQDGVPVVFSVPHDVYGR